MMRLAEGAAPDWSCIGSGGAGGSGGGTGQNVFRLSDFSSGAPLADVEVELYAGDSIIGKTAFLTSFTKGPGQGPAELGEGEFFFAAGAPTISYRAKATTSVKASFGFAAVVPPAPGVVEGYALKPTTYEQLAAFAVPLVGWEPPADLAMLLTQVTDCSGNAVGGALVKLVDETTGQELQAGTCARDVHYLYFDTVYPNPKCTFTHPGSGTFLVVNAVANASGPAQAHKFRLEFWGRLQELDSQPKRFAQRSVDLFPGALNIHAMKPQ